VVCIAAGLNTWMTAAIAFVIGYTVRILAVDRGWDEPLAKEPAGVYPSRCSRVFWGASTLPDLNCPIVTP
jgi:hypothetical protein